MILTAKELFVCWVVFFPPSNMLTVKRTYLDLIYNLIVLLLFMNGGLDTLPYSNVVSVDAFLTQVSSLSHVEEHQRVIDCSSLSTMFHI